MVVHVERDLNIGVPEDFINLVMISRLPGGGESADLQQTPVLSPKENTSTST
jgi:hypothetical protein